MDRTDFLAHLAELGIPHDLTIHELEVRYGVQKATYYDWPVIRISDARPMVPGQVEPPEFQPRLQPDLLPPPDFSAVVSAATDARTNHALTLGYLTARLGRPTETSTSNTIGHRWSFDTAFVSLLAWPPELQTGMPSNPTHDRHPEMNAFCHLKFAAGHVVPLGAHEREWMTGALALPPGGTGVFGEYPGQDPLSSLLRGSFRRLPADSATRRAFVGLSADTAALVGMDGDTGFVLPQEAVLGLDLLRIASVRGGPGSRLWVRYRDPFTSKGAERSKEIFVGAQRTSLDEVTRAVARWAEVQTRESEGRDD